MWKDARVPRPPRHSYAHKEIIYCDLCDDELHDNEALTNHMRIEHRTGEWNCNSCPFQATSTNALFNHIKLSGHQPSPTVQSPKTRITQCYTCKHEFKDYWSLMNHRRDSHPSKKLCRYFAKGECAFQNDCWYSHKNKKKIGNTIDAGSSQPESSTFSCHMCAETFISKHQLMSHKKNSHQPTRCENMI